MALEAGLRVGKEELLAGRVLRLESGPLALRRSLGLIGYLLCPNQRLLDHLVGIVSPRGLELCLLLLEIAFSSLKLHAAPHGGLARLGEPIARCRVRFLGKGLLPLRLLEEAVGLGFFRLRHREVGRELDVRAAFLRVRLDIRFELADEVRELLLGEVTQVVLDGLLGSLKPRLGLPPPAHDLPRLAHRLHRWIEAMLGAQPAQLRLGSGKLIGELVLPGLHPHAGEPREAKLKAATDRLVVGSAGRQRERVTGKLDLEIRERLDPHPAACRLETSARCLDSVPRGLDCSERGLIEARGMERRLGLGSLTLGVSDALEPLAEQPKVECGAPVLVIGARQSMAAFRGRALALRALELGSCPALELRRRLDCGHLALVSGPQVLQALAGPHDALHELSSPGRGSVCVVQTDGRHFGLPVQPLGLTLASCELPDAGAQRVSLGLLPYEA